MDLEECINNSKAFIGHNVQEQVAIDLAVYLENFSNRSFAIKYLAKESGLNEKTIQRLLKQNNRPTYQTLFKLYSIFYDESEFKKLLNIIPTGISNYLQSYTPCDVVSKVSDNHDFLDTIKKDPLMAELFVLSGTGPLHRQAMAYRYGEYGLELISKLESLSYLKKIDKDIWTISDKAPNLDADSLKFLGEYFVSKFSKPKNGELSLEHIISFYAEGLNEKGKEKWMQIDSQSFYKKMKIAKDSRYQGDIPVFTFTSTDTILTENQNV
ncbi:MAG: hypothetical protein KC493_09855 [Bacteriovoracaceae bacterium]|nr:hypothetical protein [Bacteriovoracaceae bacterium]